MAVIDAAVIGTEYPFRGGRLVGLRIALAPFPAAIQRLSVGVDYHHRLLLMFVQLAPQIAID